MKLLEPWHLRGRVAPNRVLFGPHVTNLGDGRALSPRHVAYYERRAAGGCGTIVVEEASVHPSDWPYERSPLAAECGDGWAAVVDACRPHGSLVMAAIGHSGGQGSSAYSQRELWAPSGVPEVNTRELPKVMEADDIAAAVAAFGEATRAAVAAGVDGVEVNAGQHSLVRQFLSGLTNLRGDDWGADKLRFAREVLSVAREAAGDAVVGLRLSCDELAPWAGLVPEAATEVAVALQEWIDYVVVVRGAIFSVSATRPDGHDEPGFNLDLAGMVRAAVDPRVAVVAQGSIVDVGQAEWALDDGRADAVEMTRAQIADPDLAVKASADPARIRPCVLCNQTCQVRDGRNPIVTCVGEPRSGHEASDPSLDPAVPAAGGGRLLVVGGGVAGLEAARVAAERGASVRLVERTGRVGGAVRSAAVGSGRHRLAALVDWLESECGRLGVEIALDTPWDGDADGFDAVVAAIGGVARTVEFDLADGRVPVSARAVLDTVADLPDGVRFAEGPVVIDDTIGGPIGISVAETLAARGDDVTLVSGDFTVGTMLSLSGDLAPANVRLAQAGVTLVKRSVVRRYDATGVTVEDRYSGEHTLLPAAVLIDAGHRLPDPDPRFRAEASPDVVRIGDAVAPRTIHEAVLEARRAAIRLTS